jgi:ATP-dependent DNA ligase
MECKLFSPLKPMLAGRLGMQKIEEIVERDKYLWEIKYDGERV